MNKKSLIFFLIVLFLQVTGAASNKTNSMLAKTYGLGLIIGDPTGFSGKYFITSREAIDFALDYWFSKHLHIHGDYLYHFHSFLPGNNVHLNRISFYTGGGGKIYLRDNGVNKDELSLAIRIPAGIFYLVPQTPLELFLELVPTMSFVPSTEFEIDFAIGVRYLF